MQNLMLPITVFLILLILLFFFLKNKEKRSPDYYKLFIMGVIWLCAGLAIGNDPLTIMGVSFTLVGLINKKKWEEDRIRWSQLSKREKKERIFLFIFSLLLLVIGVALYFFQQL